jgi:hypothetical protein
MLLALGAVLRLLQGLQVPVQEPLYCSVGNSRWAIHRQSQAPTHPVGEGLLPITEAFFYRVEAEAISISVFLNERRFAHHQFKIATIAVTLIKSTS